MHKIGINLEAKPGLDAAGYIARAHEVGFEALLTETPTERELSVIADALARHGMHYEMIHAPFRGIINDIWLEGEAGEHTLRELMSAVDRARAAGCVPAVVVHLSSGKTPPPVTDIGAARYDKLVEYAAAKGVRLAFENQRMPWNLAWAMERYTAPHVGFCWDCGHEGCFTPDTAFMALYGDRLFCTHIHDNDRTRDSDQHMIPFDGRINFSRVAEQLRESGFAGALTLELFAANTRVYDHLPCADYLAQAAVAAKRLRRMVDGFDW